MQILAIVMKLDTTNIKYYEYEYGERRVNSLSFTPAI